ncbi:MAG TPA: class I SAM-dependent methyltransferase [Saprospiraceae bacterium]|nr:class I SAM-dependent methyltransferase [Saprospiraceae bacterium]
MTKWDPPVRNGRIEFFPYISSPLPPDSSGGGPKMIARLKKLLSNPFFYHYSRQVLLLGMPLKTWAAYGNYYNKNERIADLGCGPADILRYTDPPNKPAFYLGIDQSGRYLKRAASRAAQKNISSAFINLNLDLLPSNEGIKTQLIRSLDEYQITTVNLFGVLHHLNDLAVVTTLNAVFDSASVRSLNTQDVLFLARNPINNFYASLDRGEYVRTEAQYDALLNKSKWQKMDKAWSRAGVRKVKYIHYRLKK